MKILKIIYLIFAVLLLATTTYAEATELNFSRQSVEHTDQSSDTLANFRMKAIRQDPQPANPGDYVDIYFNIDNFGGDISNPRFEFNNLKYPFSLDPSSDSNILQLLFSNPLDEVFLLQKSFPTLHNF